MYGPQSCPTVTIQVEKTEDNPTGLVVINESDYNPETMTKVDPVPEQQQPASTEQQPPADNGEKKVVAPWAQ
jgi:hypothetical protein